MVFFILETFHTRMAVFILVAALGVSMLTTYLNAWGEAVLSHYSQAKNHQMNKAFRSGLLGFELRMFLIIVGLLSGKLIIALSLILILGTITVWQRFSNIMRTLKDVQN